MKKSLYLLLAAVLLVSCHKDKKTDESVTGPFVFFEARVGEAGTLPQRDGELSVSLVTFRPKTL